MLIFIGHLMQIYVTERIPNIFGRVLIRIVNYLIFYINYIDLEKLTNLSNCLFKISGMVLFSKVVLKMISLFVLCSLLHEKKKLIVD